MQYLLMWVALFFGLGIAVAHCVGLPIWPPLALGAALLLLSVAARRRSVRWSLLLGTVLLVAFAHATAVDEPFPTWLILRARALEEGTGIVTSYPSLGDDYVTFTLRLDHLPAALRVTWFVPGETPGRVHFGDRVSVRGSVRLPEPFEGFDYPGYLADRGIFATMLADGEGAVVVLGPSGGGILRVGDRLRQSIVGSLRRALGPLVAGMAQGILFGDRAALPEEIDDAFRRTGLMHVLAVSGLHLGILLAGVWFVLRRAGLRPAVAYPIVAVLVLSLLWIVGPRVSLLRASLLFGFLALGSVLADLGLILRRSVRPLNGLAAAAVVLLALRPSDLGDAGFQLTFAATAGILLAISGRFREAWTAWVDGVAARAGRWARPARNALTLLVISAAAQATVIPIVAWHFGTFHPLLLGLNLIVIPLVTLALWAGLPTVLLLSVGAPAVCAAPFGWILRALAWAVSVGARLPGVELPASAPLACWFAAAAVYFVAVYRYASESS